MKKTLDTMDPDWKPWLVIMWELMSCVKYVQSRLMATCMRNWFCVQDHCDLKTDCGFWTWRIWQHKKSECILLSNKTHTTEEFGRISGKRECFKIKRVYLNSTTRKTTLPTEQPTTATTSPETSPEKPSTASTSSESTPEPPTTGSSTVSPELP